MRQILFRGKRTNNGEWVIGFLVMCKYTRNDGGNLYYVTKPNIIPIGNIGEADYDGDGNYYEYEVIPETVGQYTGLKDKNGKKIFEGDIVLTQEFYDKPYSKNRKAKKHTGEVEYVVHTGKGFYNKETVKWDKHIDYGAEWKVIVKDYGKFVHGSWGDFFDCEVIGNIHDNLELLKGE